MALIKVKDVKISIHALLAEGDKQRQKQPRIRQHFYPRPPRGGRREIYAQGTAEDNISIHALLAEGDCAVWRQISG